MITKENQKNRDAIPANEEQMKDRQRLEGRLDKNVRTRNEEEFAPLFTHNESEEFRRRWLDIQSCFVDDPNMAVKEADELVTNVIQNITDAFADKRMSVENQWKSGEKVSTEDMRVALKRYRSFFNRLLSLES
jgi:hypothetical protein